MSSKDPYNTNSNKKKMLEALNKSMGIVSTACEQVGISRWTHYEWLKHDEQYEREVEAINERTGDFVEGKLLTNIKEGDTTAIIFYAKTRLKKRGYVERIEQTGADGGPVSHSVAALNVTVAHKQESDDDED